MVSTISIREEKTLIRFNKCKGAHQAIVGHDVTSEEFISLLLDRYENTPTVDMMSTATEGASE